MGRWMVAVTVVLASVACQAPWTSTGCSNVAIDWVDFIQVGSVQYVAGLDAAPTVTSADLGPVVAHVKFKVDGNVCDPSYHPKDGDAAFLEPGTPIYQVTGHPMSNVLAAERDGQIVVYQSRPA